MQKENGLPNETSPENAGLVLDDLLNAIEWTQQQYELPRCKIESAKILAFPDSAQALERITRDTIEKHGNDLCSKRHPLLDEPGEGVLGETVKTSAYSGQRVRHGRVEKVLEHVLLVGLQTVSELPSRDPKPPNARKQLKSLAAALSRLAQRIKAAQRNQEVRWRIDHVLQTRSKETPRLWQVCDEMRAVAEVLSSAAQGKVKKIASDSPNPQIRLTLYLADWVRKCTGAPHYAELQTLLQAAFGVAGKASPKWIDRLGIEMHSKRQRRRRWGRAILSKS